MMACYRDEFPDFNPETMPPIPAAWKDTSWHNDSCPSFRTMTGCVVFIDFADVSLREIQEPGDRFSVQADPEMHGHNETLFVTDDWSAVLAFVIANAFAIRLTTELGLDSVREINSRNAAETSHHVCHSHDFCDANMVMAEAFRIALDRDTDLDSEDDIRLWNSAWEMAVANKFWSEGLASVFEKKEQGMLEKLHPDAAKILILGGYLASDPEMEKNINRVVRYKNWTPSMGTVARDYTFTIVGVQRLYDGSIAYRVLCNGFNDTFGRPARPDEIEFVQ